MKINIESLKIAEISIKWENIGYDNLHYKLFWMCVLQLWNFWWLWRDGGV